MHEPSFPLLGQLADDAEGASGTATVPEGKGGHVFVDGTLHRIKDLDAPIKGDGAFAFSVNEAELAQLCEFVDVAFLGFKGLRTTTLAPLTQMKRLCRLQLWWVQKLADLSPLAELPLEGLILDDLRYANDISPLARIAGLKALILSGGMNSTQVIDTLEPLTDLPELRELRLVALKLGDDTLRPLERCKALTDLWLPNTFDVSEYAYLAAKRPDLRSNALRPYEILAHRMSGKDVMVTGKRRPFLNSKTDGDKMAKYQAQFEALVAEFRGDATGG
ncbi:hypothetical protein [Cognatiyoonia sp. IB215182]|uniref:hypothetical protein n=1 Tax=Cognatiyoonia sp. IB215182 TaxID=3097353 RepID=UPI002A14A392|nr:hypothetical protein [Cognatiyoonia sp. IB215182]MDX8350781.1 hypothetical protein [Cognatiyoonia sp. IB215182]